MPQIADQNMDDLISNYKMSGPDNGNMKSVEILNRFKHLNEEEVAHGKWLKLANYKYTDCTGKERCWEVAERVTRKHDCTVDCVSTLPVLRRMLKYDCLILVKQYRPAMKTFTLEFPAGLVDPKEEADETAIRELKEETGYSNPYIKHVSPSTALDPGLSNCRMKIVTVEVDGDEPDNKVPVQSPMDTENIEVINIPINELLTRLNSYSDEGMIVDSRVYAFAIGLAIGSKNKDK